MFKQPGECRGSEGKGPRTAKTQLRRTPIHADFRGREILPDNFGVNGMKRLRGGVAVDDLVAVLDPVRAG